MMQVSKATSARTGKYTIKGEKIDRDSIKWTIVCDKKAIDLYKELTDKMENPIRNEVISIEDLKAYLEELERFNDNERLKPDNARIKLDIINMLNNSGANNQFVLTIYVHELHIRSGYIMKPSLDIQFDLESISSEPMKQEILFEEPKQLEIDAFVDKELKTQDKQQSEKEIDDIKQHFPKQVFLVKCRKVDYDQVICYLDYDGSEIARQVYTKLLNQNIAVSIDNPIVTLSRQQFGEMLIEINKTDEADKGNTDVMLKILSKLDGLQPDDEFSFEIIISNYYKQSGNAMKTVNLIELVFDDSAQSTAIDEPTTETIEKRQFTQEELIILQEQAQELRQEIKKLQTEKAKLEDASSRLKNENSTIESSDEVIRMINEFQIELKQIRTEKDDLIRKTFALNDEILELKKLLLKVKYDASI